MSRAALPLLLVAALLPLGGCKAARERVEAERRKACPETGPRLRTIPVDLPRAATGELRERITALVSVTADGGLRVNGVEEQKQDLVARLRALRRDRPDLEVVIHADRNARHGDVVTVIDAARQAGIQRIAFHIALDLPAPRH